MLFALDVGLATNVSMLENCLFNTGNVMLSKFRSPCIMFVFYSVIFCFIGQLYVMMSPQEVLTANQRTIAPRTQPYIA